MNKYYHQVATSTEMQELVNLAVLTPYNVGVQWTSYEGAPFGCHIRWTGEGFGTIRGSDYEAQIIRDWIQHELHTDCE